MWWYYTCISLLSWQITILLYGVVRHYDLTGDVLYCSSVRERQELSL